MSNVIYKVRLKPLDTFFFGGERSFGEDSEANYLVQSLLYPQQTTLLGLMRYYLLQQNNLLTNNIINDKILASELIGEKSFPNANYGVIQKLSPIFLEEIREQQALHWFPEPFDASLKYAPATGESMLNHPLKTIPAFQNYDPKAASINMVVSSGQQSKELKSIMQEIIQVGIAKTKTDDAFFRKISYRFKKTLDSDWAFMFYILLEERSDLKFSSGFVVGGAERSVFKVEVDKVTQVSVKEIGWQFPFEPPKSNINETRLTLESPAYAITVYDSYDFAYSRTQDFRHLKTSVEQTNKYYNVAKHGTTEMQRSAYSELMQAGSVFYFSDVSKLNSFTNSLNTQTDFQSIGYNYYSINSLK